MNGMKAYILPTGVIWSDLNNNVAHAVHASASDRNPDLVFGPGPMYAVLIDHPTAGWILFDTGAPLDAAERWPACIMRDLELTFGPGEDLVEQLATIGVRPCDIGHVIVSHMHMDHMGNAYLFAETADFWVAKAEAEHALTTVFSTPDPAQHGFYSKAEVTLPFRRLVYVEEDGELFPGIDAVLLPGHTPGTMGIVLHLEGGTVIVTSDGIYRQENFEGTPPGVLHDSVAWRATLAKVRKLQKRYDAKLWFGHDPTLFPTLRKIPAYYE